MENKIIARRLRLLAQLMELQEENAFRVKSVANAAFKIDKASVKLADLTVSELEKTEGVGKSIAQKVDELVKTGTMVELDQMLALTPPSIVEMLSIKGLGPKKVQIIWKQLGIENIGELYYACNENRLIEAKGFGLKTQEEIKRIIEFTMSNEGKLLFVQAEELILSLTNDLKKLAPSIEVEPAGDFARKCEIIEHIQLFVNYDHKQAFSDALKGIDGVEIGESTTPDHINSKLRGIAIEFILLHQNTSAWTRFQSIGSSAHLSRINEAAQSKNINLSETASEESIYQNLNLPYIIPELREDYSLEQLATMDHPNIIRLEHLRGTIHNHSTYSDGVHTVKEMALHCIEMGLEYLGICDHSKSAFYANGMTEEKVIKQHAEIDKLNKELAPFRIFKGIESDIRYDGSLDYDEDVLKSFDLIVASVHSQLKMTEDKANERLLKAIRNPYTTLLGHPTGRLLLAREGYPIDHRLIIDACAKHGVIIELNANPLRLDLDWRWINYAINQGVLISINPDAHRTEGLHHMQYGVNVARKAGLTHNHCFNALDLAGMETYLNKRKP